MRRGLGAVKSRFPDGAARRRVAGAPTVMASDTATVSRGSGRMRHVLSALVQNQPGVLAHVSGMLHSRGFNIDSLAVGETEDPHLSRITFVVRGDDRVLEQVRKQLEKIVTVVRVIDISREDFVERDLMLIKVDAPAERRPEIRGLVQDFRGRIVDIGPEQLMIEISGQEKKIEAFIELIRPYGIRELVRTGRIALVRSSQPTRAARRGRGGGRGRRGGAFQPVIRDDDDADPGNPRRPAVRALGGGRRDSASPSPNTPSHVLDADHLAGPAAEDRGEARRVLAARGPDRAAGPRSPTPRSTPAGLAKTAGRRGRD